MYSKDLRVEKVAKIVLNKHDIAILHQANEILNAVNEDYDCSKAIEECCPFDMGQLCCSFEAFIEMTKQED